MRRTPFADLGEAVLWLRENWSERDVPTRLHQRDFEGPAPFFTPAFARYLDATPDDKALITTERECRHLRLTEVNRSPFDCPDCAGSGMFETQATAYRYPCWRAMDRLGAFDRSHKPKGNAYSMTEVILTLVINGFSTADLVTLGHSEATQLLAIRRLHDRYERAPIKVAYTQKSESQQNADDEQLMAEAIARKGDRPMSSYPTLAEVVAA